VTMTYVFPDLHGRKDHLDKAIAGVFADGLGPDDTIVFLGDYIDRGPDSVGVVKAVRDLVNDRPNTVALSGNHEYMMIWALMGGDEHLQGWLASGGNTTISSYESVPYEQIIEDAKWFVALPKTHEDTHRVYVHAGVTAKLPLSEQDDAVLLWKRYAASDGTGWMDKHLVHGHDIDETGPRTTGNRTACDTGAFHTNRYCVSVFDDATAGGPVRVIEVHG
jgi:serine/threonine protein phosphatase 1